MQVYGVDYFKTFAPVAKLASIRSILAITTHNNWDISMFDFHLAYLNRELDEDIFMEQPPNYKMADHERDVVKLHKTLYGLKQAGRNGMIRCVAHLLTSASKSLRPILPYFTCMRAMI